MPEMSNRDWVTHGLDLLARGLKPFVDRHMRSVGDGEHWAEEFTSELAKHKGPITECSIDDPSFLLQVFCKRWKRIFADRLDDVHRTEAHRSANKLRQRRNEWAHFSPIGPDEARDVIIHVRRLLLAVDAREQDDARYLEDELERWLGTMSSGAARDARGWVAVISGPPASARRSPHAWFEADSPLGRVLVAHNGGSVTGLRIADEGSERDTILPWQRTKTIASFAEFMRDEVQTEINYDPSGAPALVERVRTSLTVNPTDVDVDLLWLPISYQTVLKRTRLIPRGEVMTYSELADAVGRPGEARLVGHALAHNPVPLLVPCHRVVPTDRRTGDFGKWGYESTLKAQLLAYEGVLE